MDQAANGHDQKKNEASFKPGPSSFVRHSAAGYMLEGYFDFVKRAVIIAVSARLGVGLALAIYLVKRWRRVRGQA